MDEKERRMERKGKDERNTDKGRYSGEGDECVGATTKETEGSDSVGAMVKPVAKKRWQKR